MIRNKNSFGHFSYDSRQCCDKPTDRTLGILKPLLHKIKKCNNNNFLSSLALLRNTVYKSKHQGCIERQQLPDGAQRCY